MDVKVLDKRHSKNIVAFNLYQKLKQLRREQGYLALEMGKILKEIKEKKLYRYLGEGGYESFRQFLADPEININYHTAQLYIRVYEFYVEKLNFKEEDLLGIPLNRLNTLKPLLEKKVKDKEEVKEWIEKARTLGRVDFDEELKENKIVKVKPVELKKCRNCGKIQIVINLENEICRCSSL